MSVKQSALIPLAAQMDGIYTLSEARLREGHLQKTRSFTVGPGPTVQYRMQTGFLY